jgi:hypothetical protein
MIAAVPAMQNSTTATAAMIIIGWVEPLTGWVYGAFMILPFVVNKTST